MLLSLQRRKWMDVEVQQRDAGKQYKQNTEGLQI